MFRGKGEVANEGDKLMPQRLYIRRTLGGGRPLSQHSFDQGKRGGGKIHIHMAKKGCRPISSERLGPGQDPKFWVEKDSVREDGVKGQQTDRREKGLWQTFGGRFTSQVAWKKKGRTEVKGVVRTRRKWWKKCPKKGNKLSQLLDASHGGKPFVIKEKKTGK